MTNPGGRRQSGHRGFSLIELLVVVLIVSILMVVAISRLLALQVDAERVVMESTVGAVRSAMGIKVAEFIVKQKVSALPAYESKNPMSLLAEVPKNYLGEMEATDPPCPGERQLVFRQAVSSFGVPS